MTIDRTDIIEYRLSNHVLNDLGAGLAVPTLDEWARIEGHDLRFGWLPPRVVDGEVIVVFQPEALSLLTDTLDDNDFVIFMDTLEWLIDKHIVLIDTPLEERTRLIEDELYEINPAVLAFISHIELLAT